MARHRSVFFQTFPEYRELLAIPKTIFVPFVEWYYVVRRDQIPGLVITPPGQKRDPLDSSEDICLALL